MTDKLVEAVLKCREKFEHYVSLHMAKDPPDMDKAAANQEMVELCDAALASSSVPEQGKETALALDTLCNIHNYAFDKELPADTIIGAIRLVVSSALGELTPPPPAPHDRGASQEDGR